MSVLIFIESAEGVVKKSSLEAISYGVTLAKSVGSSVTVVSLSAVKSDLSVAGNYGATKILNSTDEVFDGSNAMAIASGIAQAAKQEDAVYILLAKTSLADAIAPTLAARLGAGLATNVTELPDLTNGFVVKRSIFTGKAFSNTVIEGAIKVLTLKKNAHAAVETGGTATIEAFNPVIADSDRTVKHLSEEKATGEVLLPEAEIVVSGGRGLKGPENWALIENLAHTLGAATACSKPVSDLHWRPHHEHVGQTGIKVSPNLYIAVGISGAIQHLAGISSSKCIVAINTDAEAPIFKAADYGIVGDAFQILPKLTAAFEAAK
jgi:electron transfer flavoprotein alpha subunit